MTISFGTNTAPYYLAVIETYSGTDYDVDNRDQRIDLGNGDPNAVIDLLLKSSTTANISPLQVAMAYTLIKARTIPVQN